MHVLLSGAHTTTWANAPHCTDRTSTCPRAGWWPCRRHIRLVNPIASVRHARSHFVRRANAVRPITDLAALDSTLIMGSPRHHPIVITERASVCLTWPSASMISYLHEPCLPWAFQGASKGATQLSTPEGLPSFSPIRAGRKGWMAPFGTPDRIPFPLAPASCRCRSRPLRAWHHQPEAGNRPARLA